MKRYTLFFPLLFLVALFSCQKDDDSTPTNNCIDESKIDYAVCCFEIYQPVCGCDGVTYPNSCIAEFSAGVTSYTYGPCDGYHDCIDSNLIIQGYTVDCSGEYDPVCGCDGITYTNSCIAQFQYGIKYFSPGPCQPIMDCIDSTLMSAQVACDYIYDPVCGCNGITYSNDCIAKTVHGVSNSTPGECPVPTCIKEQIESFKVEHFECAKIDRYYYNNSYVYLIDVGQGCIADAGYTVISNNCSTVCHFGGFTSSPDGQLCNGDNFFQTAVYVGTVWEW